MIGKIISLLGFVILMSSCGSNHHINQFYHQNKKGSETVNFTIPGWLIWFGSGIAYEHVKDPAVKAGLVLAKKMKRIRLLVSEDAGHISGKDVQQLVLNLKKNSEFEDLLYVKSESTNVTLMIKEKDEKISNLFMIVSDEEELVLMDIRTKLTMDDIQQLVKSFKKEMKLDKVKKITLPQA